jgi:hypothetical protein
MFGKPNVDGLLFPYTRVSKSVSERSKDRPIIVANGLPIASFTDINQISA